MDSVVDEIGLVMDRRTFVAVTSGGLLGLAVPMFHGSAWVESGGLMSYSADDLEAFRHAATTSIRF